MKTIGTTKASVQWWTILVNDCNLQFGPYNFGGGTVQIQILFEKTEIQIHHSKKTSNPIEIHWIRQRSSQYFADMSPNADIQISAMSALKMFADSRYADIEKKCWYADIADINIGTPLVLWCIGWVYNQLISIYFVATVINVKSVRA